MSYYKFKNRVYLVEGKVNGCIYDLNENTLFAIDADFKNALIELINNNRVVDEEFLPVIQELLQMNILEESDTPAYVRDIKEAADTETPFDLVWIEVTKQCNLKCKHCYENSSPETQSEMSFEDFQRVIQELKNLNVTKVQLIGGEPFILKDKLVKMFEYASQHVKALEVFTNATFIDESWIEIFKKYNVTVRISLHSLDGENHDKVTCVKGSFDKAYHALELMNENSVPTSITAVAMKGVNRYGIEKHPNLHLLDVVRMAGRGNLTLHDKETIMMKLRTLESMTRPFNLDILRRSLYRHQCFGYKLYIDTDLNVYPCTMERRLMHGNIRKQSLESVLNTKIFHMTKDHIEECKDCEYRYVCFDCRPDHLDQEINAKPWYCTYLPLEGRWLDTNKFIEDLHIG